MDWMISQKDNFSDQTANRLPCVSSTAVDHMWDTRCSARIHKSHIPVSPNFRLQVSSLLRSRTTYYTESVVASNVHAYYVLRSKFGVINSVLLIVLWRHPSMNISVTPRFITVELWCSLSEAPFIDACRRLLLVESGSVSSRGWVPPIISHIRHDISALYVMPLASVAGKDNWLIWLQDRVPIVNTYSQLHITTFIREIQPVNNKKVN